MICSTSGEEVAEGSSQKVEREIPTMCMEYQNPIQKQYKPNTKHSLKPKAKLFLCFTKNV